METDPVAQVTLLASREYLPKVGDSTLVYLAVQLNVLKQRQGPLNLALVIDRSLAMVHSERLDLVIEACKYLVTELAGEDFCSIVTFAQKVRVLASGQVATNRSEMLGALTQIAKIDPLDIGVESNLNTGLKTGETELTTQMNHSQVDRVILFTDGRVSIETYLSLTKSENYLAMPVTVVTLGDNFDEGLLTAIAEKTGGNYYYVSDPTNIFTVVEAELKWLRSICWKQVLLKLSLTANITLVSAWRFSPEIMALALPKNSQTIQYNCLGGLSSQQGIGFLLGLYIPAFLLDSMEIARFQLSTLGAKPEESLAVANLVLKSSRQKQLYGTINSSVIALAERVALDRLKEEAETTLMIGGVKKAILLYNAARATAEKLGEVQLGQIFEKLMMQITSGGNVDTLVAKNATTSLRIINPQWLAELLPAPPQ